MRAFEDFSGGLWLPGDTGGTDPQPGFAVPANGLLEAQNVEYLPSGGLRGRRGRRRVISTPYGPDASVIAMHRHYPRRGTVGTTKAAGAVASSVLLDDAVQLWQVPDGNLIGASRARCVLNTGELSYYLAVTQYGFALAADAVIAGITVTVERRAIGDITDAFVVLFLGGAPVGVSRARLLEGWGTDWETVVYGGSADLWGVNWTASNINAAGFGVGIAVRASGNGSSEAWIESVGLSVYAAAPGDPVRTLVSRNNLSTLNAIDVLAFVGVNSPILYSLTGPGRQAATHTRFVSWPELDTTLIFDGVNPVLQTTETGGTLLEAHAIVVAPDSLAPPLGPYAALHQNRVWATQPAEGSFSVYGSEVNDPTRWYGDVHLSVNDSMGGFITGLVSMTGATPLLLILKDTSLWYWVGDPLSGGQLVKYANVGCVAPDSVAVTPAGVVFVGTDGVFLTDGQSPQPQRLSDPISALFLGRTADTIYRTAVGAYYPKKQQYYLKLDRTAEDGHVLHFLGDRVAWSSIDHLPFTAGCVYSAAADDGQLVTIGRDGFAYQLDVGRTDDDGSQAGDSIRVQLRTRSAVVDDRTPLLREGRVAYVKPQYRGQGGLSGALAYDESTTVTVPFALAAGAALAFQHPRATITDMAHFGRVVNVTLFNGVDGPDFELHRIGCDVQLRTVRQWRT